MPWLGRLFFDVVENGVRLFNLLLRFGFHHFAQTKAEAIQHRGHRTRRGQVVCGIALPSERVQRCCGCQSRVGQTRSKGRVLLRMRFSELPKRLGRLRLRVFPAFTSTVRGLGSHTNHPRASFRQAKLNGMASPTEHRFG